MNMGEMITTEPGYHYSGTSAPYQTYRQPQNLIIPQTTQDIVPERHACTYTNCEKGNTAVTMPTTSNSHGHQFYYTHRPVMYPGEILGAPNARCYHDNTGAYPYNSHYADYHHISYQTTAVITEMQSCSWMQNTDAYRTQAGQSHSVCSGLQIPGGNSYDGGKFPQALQVNETAVIAESSRMLFSYICIYIYIYILESFMCVFLCYTNTR